MRHAGRTARQERVDDGTHIIFCRPIKIAKREAFALEHITAINSDKIDLDPDEPLP